MSQNNHDDRLLAGADDPALSAAKLCQQALDAHDQRPRGLLFVDTETTGRDPGSARIVQLAAVLSDASGRIMGQMCVLIQPDGWDVPADAQAVHGISTEECRRFGVPLIAALRAYNRFEELADLLVAHNVDYDRSVLFAEHMRCGVPCRIRLCPGYPWHLPTFCTMKAGTDICRIPGVRGYKWPRLEELHRHCFGTLPDGAHDALGDVLATMKCYFHLWGKAGDLPRDGLPPIAAGSRAK